MNLNFHELFWKESLSIRPTLEIYVIFGENMNVRVYKALRAPSGAKHDISEREIDMNRWKPLAYRLARPATMFEAVRVVSLVARDTACLGTCVR